MVEPPVGAVPHELTNRPVIEVIRIQQRILARTIRRREFVNQPALRRVNSAGRQDGAGKLGPLPLVDADAGDAEGVKYGDGNVLPGHRGQRIREIATPLGGGRHRTQVVQRIVEAHAFVADEEERLIGAIVQLGDPHRAAQRPRKILHFKRRTRNALRIITEAIRIQRFVAQAILAGAMELIGAALRGEDHRALRAAILGAHVVDVGLHLLNALRIGQDCYLVPRRSLNRHAVHLNVAGEGVAAVHREVRHRPSRIGPNAEARRRLRVVHRLPRSDSLRQRSVV